MNTLYDTLTINVIVGMISMAICLLGAIYNSLTVIKSVCRNDPSMAEQAIGEFAQYLRYNICGYFYGSYRIAKTD